MSKKFIIILFFFVIINSNRIFSINSDKTIQEKVEKSLYTIAYPDNPLIQESAANTLLDYPQISTPLLKNMLLQADISSKSLINIWRLFYYNIETVPKCKLTRKEFQQIVDIQNHKFLFLQELFLQNYTNYFDTINPLIEEWVNEKNSMAFNVAITLIIKLQLSSFIPSIIQFTKNSDNKVLIEHGVVALQNLTITDPSILKPLIPLFDNESTVIRYQTQELFKKFPIFQDILIKKLKKTDSYLTGSYLIKTLTYYNMPEKTQFFLSYLKKNSAYLTEIIPFLRIVKYQEKDILTMLKILKGSYSFSKKQAVIDIFEHIQLMSFNKKLKKQINKIFTQFINNKNEYAILRKKLKKFINKCNLLQNKVLQSDK